MMRNRNLQESVEQAFKQIAEQEGITEEDVKQEIQAAMDQAMKESCSQSHPFWANGKEMGRKPTPEELVIYCVNKILEHH